MQARGLIDRTPDPNDRRSVQVSLTEQGRTLARQLVPVARRMEQGLKKRLTAADHARLIQLLHKLADGPVPSGL
jgi:DNA-binding MarR family transcriptional regulator